MKSVPGAKLPLAPGTLSFRDAPAGAVTPAAHKKRGAGGRRSPQLRRCRLLPFGIGGKVRQGVSLAPPRKEARMGRLRPCGGRFHPTGTAPRGSHYEPLPPRVPDGRVDAASDDRLLLLRLLRTTATLLFSLRVALFDAGLSDVVLHTVLCGLADLFRSPLRGLSGIVEPDSAVLGTPSGRGGMSELWRCPRNAGLDGEWSPLPGSAAGAATRGHAATGHATGRGVSTDLVGTVSGFPWTILHESATGRPAGTDDG